MATFWRTFHHDGKISPAWLGGCTPSPFRSIYHHKWSCGVRFSWEGRSQSTHRVAMANFWRIFHHVGKISPASWGWGCTPSSYPFIYHLEESSGATEWQWPLSGTHSIMMVKSAQPGEGGCTPSPFHSIYHHKQSCGVRSSWDGISQTTYRAAMANFWRTFHHDSKISPAL